MIFSIYEELIGLTTATEEQVLAKLAEMHIAHIFGYLIENHKGKGWIRPIVQFAAYTYSWETKMVKVGQDWQRTKKQIADKVQLPPEAYDDVVNLKDSRIVECFMDFLHLYRDNMDYVHLNHLKDHYQQVMMGSAKIRQDGAGNAHVDDKYEDIKKGTKLLQEIKEMEEELRKKYIIEQRSAKDFVFDKSEHANPLLIENSPLIRG